MNFLVTHLLLFFFTSVSGKFLNTFGKNCTNTLIKLYHRMNFLLGEYDQTVKRLAELGMRQFFSFATAITNRASGTRKNKIKI